MSSKTEYSHQASSPNDQHLAAHFPSRPEFALFTSLSYRFHEDRRPYLLYVSICSFLSLFLPHIHHLDLLSELSRRSGAAHRPNVLYLGSGYVESPVPNTIAWHDIMIAALSARWRWLYFQFFSLVPFRPRGYLISIFAVSVTSERSTVNGGQ